MNSHTKVLSKEVKNTVEKKKTMENDETTPAMSPHTKYAEKYTRKRRVHHATNPTKTKHKCRRTLQQNASVEEDPHSGAQKNMSALSGVSSRLLSMVSPGYFRPPSPKAHGTSDRHHDSNPKPYFHIKNKIRTSSNTVRTSRSWVQPGPKTRKI
ncbi:hypothetical protein CDAR_318831 [Caerostris darwini]|uniref:Uncharacterized protein n=1 Tax=Caerostris darwini TaxID=1538125 RepID=A0AAV4W6D2_9ARAC|nr:hypothetical protein CDAR_318831 [Caerostris darwini]